MLYFLISLVILNDGDDHKVWKVFAGVAVFFFIWFGFGVAVALLFPGIVPGSFAARVAAGVFIGFIFMFIVGMVPH
jgi:hypothetical protein